MVYEKRQVLKAQQLLSPRAESSNEIDVDSCQHCQRPKVAVKCMDCGHLSKNCRVKKTCPHGHKYLFLMDLERCSNCRSPKITEDNDLSPTPTHKYSFELSKGLEGLSFFDRVASISEASESTNNSMIDDTNGPAKVEEVKDENKTLQVFKDSETSQSNATAKRERDINANFATLSGMKGRGRGGRARDSSGSYRADCKETEKKASALKDCICNRGNKLIVCRECTWIEINVKKNIPCPAHPGVATGTFDACPDCNAPAASLAEYSYGE